MDEVTAQAARIDTLISEIESCPDPALRARVAELVQALLALHGEGLARIIDLVAKGDSSPAATLKGFAADDLISHLLYLHDLHPVDLETRVAGALEEVRPYLQSHGGDVELLGITEGVAHLRLQGHCNGCPSSTMTLKLAIEEAIQRAAPDLIAIKAEGVAEPTPMPYGFIPLSAVT